ncbi:MAG: 5-formyltetrahydrofolate cyclo-ligase [Proteobacteria bacterium]|nr:5-formyltetrahydrofolate cyclo-ligase [Pseudomonadota bacterium]
MEDVGDKKVGMVKLVRDALEGLATEELDIKRSQVEERLFEFANYMESKIVLLYMKKGMELNTKHIIERSFEKNKIVVLALPSAEKHKFTLMKISNLDEDLIEGPDGNMEPDSSRCKAVPIDRIDIAIIPGVAFDEKGGRIGTDDGYYDRLVSRLPITTRKIAVAYEEQVVQQIPMDSRNKHVDIIITDQRIIYKI